MGRDYLQQPVIPSLAIWNIFQTNWSCNAQKKKKQQQKQEGGKSGKEERREQENEAHAQSKGSIGLNIWVFLCLVPVAGDNIFSGGYLNSILRKTKTKGVISCIGSTCQKSERFILLPSLLPPIYNAKLQLLHELLYFALWCLVFFKLY